ncbi:hypothetical protein GCM10023093_30610 [Nemorincola caseinilytica]|uniref:Lipocalin-like domain-containing protein n=1 Tax=Nemorincola caseinilytica TaxID=2054315 RepID=A0ABP8NSG7_9BACT
MNKRPAYFVLLLVLLLGSCRERTEKKILGKWRSVRIEERGRDDFFRDSKRFIDTMGNGDSDETKLELYGTLNIDSLRQELQKQYDSAYAALKDIETRSTLHFKEDSSVVVGFPGTNELGKWYINDSGLLVLDETNKYGETEHLFIAIRHLVNDTLQLAFMRETEEGRLDTSVVTFQREKN